MKATATEIDDKVDKLLTCLDKDSQHIQESLSQLSKLRSYVIKRDDSGLSQLLNIIQAETSSYRNHESNRQTIRKELANALGCNTEQMTLSALEARLPKGKKDQIIKKKAKLMSLINELKKEHLSTTMLLSDCARFNSMLLTSTLELGQAGTITYSPRGSAERQTNSAFVNLQL